MWLLYFIPDTWVQFFIHAITLLGLVLYFASGFIYTLTNRWLPTVPQAALVIKVTGGIMLLAGIYFQGGHNEEMSWRLKVAEMQTKVAKAEAQSNEVTIKLIEAQSQKEDLLRQLNTKISIRIQQNKNAINQTCRLDPTVVQLYNEIVRGQVEQK